MKNIIKNLVVMQGLLCSALFGVDVNYFAIENYSGLAHEAFRVAESALQKKLFNRDEQYAQDVWRVPFLKSFCFTQESCNTPSAYALVCGDIDADMLWIDGDYECRTQIKEIASKIVYCPIDCANDLFGYDSYIFATGCAELKKLCSLCNELKNHENYCFALVTQNKESSLHYGVIIVDKQMEDIDFNVYGIFDDRVIEFLKNIIMDDIAREKILVQSLQKYYSPALVKLYKPQFGLSDVELSDDSNSWWQRIVNSAYDSIKKLKVGDYLPSF